MIILFMYQDKQILDTAKIYPRIDAKTSIWDNCGPRRFYTRTKVSCRAHDVEHIYVIQKSVFLGEAPLTYVPIFLYLASPVLQTCQGWCWF